MICFLLTILILVMISDLYIRYKDRKYYEDTLKEAKKEQKELFKRLDENWAEIEKNTSRRIKNG